MPTHDHFERIAEFKERFGGLPTATLIERMTSGALYKEAAIALRELIKERSDSAERATIYIALKDEGVDVWRPVEASVLGDSLFQILSARDSETEHWQFPSGAIVRCAERSFEDGETGLAAIELAYVPAA
jgi:hypothetical protein